MTDEPTPTAEPKTATATVIQMPFDAETFRLDVAIDSKDLNLAFVTQASLYAYYGQAFVNMMRQEARAKLSLDVVEAKLDKRIRDEATTNGSKITEVMVKQMITRDPSCIKAELALNDARAATALAQVAIDSFRQRRDMLIQIGASDRQEQKGDMSVGKASREELAAELRRRMAQPVAA